MNVTGAFAEVIQILFSIYSFLIIARFMLQLGGADFYNPISQGVVKATHIPLTGIRKIIPSAGRYDFASLVWLFVVQVIMLITLGLMVNGVILSPIVLVIGGLKQAASALLSFWFFTLIVSVIASWIAMGQRNPALDLVDQLSRPLLAPIQRVIPPLGGLDLSPMVAFLVILFLQRLFGL